MNCASDIVHSKLLPVLFHLGPVTAQTPPQRYVFRCTPRAKLKIPYLVEFVREGGGFTPNTGEN